MYDKNDIIEKTRIGIGKIEELYQNKIINYIGKTSDTKEEYSEVIAEELLNLGIKNKIKNINVVIRQDYCIKSHNGKVTSNTNVGISNRKEELFAMNLFNESKKGRSFNDLGKIIDYQIPLKDKLTDKVGKIDLISKNDQNIFLIELKIQDNKETLLRCILEIATYYQILSKPKFISSYTNEFKDLTAEDHIKKVILISEDSQQHKELKSINNGEKKNLHKLMADLGVQAYVINEVSLNVAKA